MALAVMQYVPSVHQMVVARQLAHEMMLSRCSVRDCETFQFTKQLRTTFNRSLIDTMSSHISLLKPIILITGAHVDTHVGALLVILYAYIKFSSTCMVQNAADAVAAVMRTIRSRQGASCLYSH